MNLKNKIIVQLCLVFAIFFADNFSYAKDIDEMLDCEKLRDSAISKDKDIPNNFIEICESLKTFQEVEELVETEQRELDKVASDEEKEAIKNDILGRESEPIRAYHELNKNSVVDRPVRSPSSAIELNASTSDDTVSLRLGLLDSASSVSEKVDDNGIESETAKFSSLSLTASSPLASSDDGLTNIATLDGLTDSTRLELRFNQFFLKGIRNPGVPANSELEKTETEICTL